MDAHELDVLSALIATREHLATFPLGSHIIARRGTEVSIRPRDVRHASVVVELDPEEIQTERIKGVRVRFEQPQTSNWSELEQRFGPFTEVSELLDAAHVPPTRVATIQHKQALAQTIRIAVNANGLITSFVVRERYD